MGPMDQTVVCSTGCTVHEVAPAISAIAVECTEAARPKRHAMDQFVGASTGLTMHECVPAVSAAAVECTEVGRPRRHAMDQSVEVSTGLTVHERVPAVSAVAVDRPVENVEQLLDDIERAATRYFNALDGMCTASAEFTEHALQDFVSDPRARRSMFCKK